MFVLIDYTASSSEVNEQRETREYIHDYRMKIIAGDLDGIEKCRKNHARVYNASKLQ